jgi:hypothetical protein
VETDAVGDTELARPPLQHGPQRSRPDEVQLHARERPPARERLEEHGVTLVLLEARDAQGQHATIGGQRAGPVGVSLGIDARVHDVDSLRVAVLREETAVVVGDRHAERRVRELASEHALVDEDVVRVRRDAVRRPREPPADPRREGRIRRVVGVHVLDAAGPNDTCVRRGDGERHKGSREYRGPPHVLAHHHPKRRK